MLRCSRPERAASSLVTGVAVLFVGHGSRRGGANRDFERLVADYARAHGDVVVAHGYVELAEPGVDAALDAAARAARRVVVLPLFLFAAGHVKNDLPLALASARERHPTVRFAIGRELGVHALMAEAVEARARQASPASEWPATTVVLVGRGSSDPDSNAEFCKLARFFAEGRAFARVEPCFMGITTPLVPETLERLATLRPERLLVLPYLLFPGRLVDRLRRDVEAFAERFSWIPTKLGPHLGAHPSVFALIDARVEAALGNDDALPCDTCQYRVALPSRAREVGGARALLWSLRHTFTHTQAAPHEQAHRSLRKHVLVCTNVDCAERGGGELIDALRRLVKARGLAREIRVTRTMCMGRCGEGPAVAVYPDGVWYRGVTCGDARELVDEHLAHDRLVARLVDDIMQ